MHFYDGGYETSPNATLFPPDATVESYRLFQTQLGLDRTVVVQPSTYGLDNRCQLDAMGAMRRAAGDVDNVRGVMVLDRSVTAVEVDTLHELGVRGARFHMLPGGAVPWDDLEPVARTIADHRWHVQLQLNGRELVDRLDLLLGLPCGLVIDHIGRFMPPVSPTHRAFRALCALVEQGAWVKLSAPYESSREAEPHVDVHPLVEALVDLAPERMLWASNWPHPGQPNPPTPDTLLNWVNTWLPSTKIRHAVLVDNAATLYEFPALADPQGDRT